MLARESGITREHCHQAGLSIACLYMKYRQLGKTGISVSEIGFGTWGIGGITEGATSYGETDDTESLRALARAMENGINFYDTSNTYGYGHAEELLGQAFSASREKVIIATKVGSVKHGGPYDVSPSYIRACLEDSLRRLKSSYIDVYLFHSVPLELVRATPGCLETLKDLKKEGKIRVFGYSVKNPADAVTAIKEFGMEVIQINFNMIDQRALTSGVFAAARAQGTGIIIRTPFCFGFLTDTITDTQFDSRDHRSAWPNEQLQRWQEAPKSFSLSDPIKRYTPAQLALKFCIGFPDVSTVVPGMLTNKEVDENSAASDLPALTAEQLKMIEKINRDNIFFVNKNQ